jgi:hypothetical protein
MQMLSKFVKDGFKTSKVCRGSLQMKCPSKLVAKKRGKAGFNILEVANAQRVARWRTLLNEALVRCHVSKSKKPQRVRPVQHLNSSGDLLGAFPSHSLKHQSGRSKNTDIELGYISISK